MRSQRRKPWLAALLTFLCPPLGFIYSAEIKKSFIVSILIVLLVPISYFLLKIKLSIVSLSVLLILLIAIEIFIISYAYKTAKSKPINYTTKWYNNFIVYIIVFICFSIVIVPSAQFLTKRYLVQAYKVTAGSMIPTIGGGDHILVDKFIYAKNKVNRNDIVVFPLPKDPRVQYIKRVVCLPGDELEIKNKNLYINNKLQHEPYIVHSDSRILPEKVSPRDNFGPAVVPEDSVFVLGDNRDNSFDSRFWGFVPIDSIKGKVVKVYWSWDNTQ